MEVEELFKLAELTDALRNTERQMFLAGSDRHENDLEHQYQLAFIAWSIIDREGLTLNRQLVLEYSLIHDVVEAYVGDTFFFADEQARTGKKERERLAIKKIQQDFPSWPELAERIREYEDQVSAEAKFVFALDCLIPIINNIRANGRIWKEHGITFDELIVKIEPKIKVDPTVKRLCGQLLEILKKDSAKYFG